MIAALREQAAARAAGRARLEFRPTSLHGRARSCRRRGDPPAVGRAVEQLAHRSATRLVLKIVRRVAAGVHPEGEMTRYLTERGFANTAPLYRRGGARRRRRHAAHAGPRAGLRAQPGRRLGLDARLPGAHASRSSRSPAQRAATPTSDAFAGYSVFAAAIGRRLANCTRCCRSPPTIRISRRAGRRRRSCDGWADGAIEQIDGAFDAAARACASGRTTPTRRAGRRAARARAGRLQRRGRAGWRARAAARCGRACTATSISARCWSCRATPSSSTSRASRRGRWSSGGRRRSPLRDVAGLLRSFDYAAAAAAPGRTAASAQTGGAARCAARALPRARRARSVPRRLPRGAARETPTRGCRARRKRRCSICS